MQPYEELVTYLERELEEGLREKSLYKRELFFSPLSSLDEVRIGVDIGYYKSYGAYLRLDGERYFLENFVVKENSLFAEVFLSTVSQLGVGLVVVEELTSRPLRGRMSWEEWRKLKSIRKSLLDAFRSARLPVVSSRAVKGDAWYGGGTPGWRQRLTGLRKPSERDVFHYLVSLRRAGKLVGYLPSNENLVDAIGMAVWAFEYPFTVLKR